MHAYMHISPIVVIKYANPYDVHLIPFISPKTSNLKPGSEANILAKMRLGEQPAVASQVPWTDRRTRNPVAT